MGVLAPGEGVPAEAGVRFVGRPVRVPYRGTVAPINASRRAWRRIKVAIGSFDPDVMHVHEPMSPSTSMLATLAANGPVVATFHAYLDRSRLLEVAAPALAPVWRRLSAAVAVSDAAAAFLRRAFPGAQVEVIPNGVDVEAFADAVARADGLPEGRRILWVNRLDPQKGFPVAVDAFGQLAAERDDLVLIVAGDGRDREAVGRLPDRIREHVVMLGAVRHDELPAYFAAAEVFVAPALGQESFGIVLAEAMAAGLPIVATDIPGYRDVARDEREGLLVPPGDATALAGAIGRVLDDAELAGRLREAGRERAGAFGWDRVVPELEDVYARVSRR